MNIMEQNMEHYEQNMEIHNIFKWDNSSFRDITKKKTIQSKCVFRNNGLKHYQQKS